MNFCESEAGSLQFVAKKVTTCYGLINVGISTVLLTFMELPVAITLLLGSIPNSVHFQLRTERSQG